MMNSDKHLFRGVLAGIGGGLAACWVMNLFLEGPGQKLQHSLRTSEEERKAQAAQLEEEAHGKAQEDATMKAADTLVRTATGGRRLSWEGKRKGGPFVHYSFGALMGGIYGGAAEFSPAARRGFGTAFGTALFAGADMVAVPAFHLSPPNSEQTPAMLAPPFAAHLVYGATTELVRRVLRAVL
jgi:putative membrane protein